MKVLWISCLLIGTIACFPSQGGKGRRNRWTTNPKWPYLTSPLAFRFSPPNPNYGKPTGQSSGSDSFNNHPALYHSGGMNMAGVDDKDSHVLVEQYSPEDGQSGGPGAGSVGHVWSSDPRWLEENWNAAASDDDNEPFFTDMSNEEPIFTLDSHSDYHQHRKVVTRARFTPRVTPRPQFSNSFGHSDPEALVSHDF